MGIAGAIPITPRYATSTTASTANAPCPSGIANTGLRSIDANFGPAAARMPIAAQHVRQCRDIRLRPTARAQQQRRALDRADHLLRDIVAKRTAAEHHVLHHLDEDAAETEHRDRSEHRVAVDAEDALDPALQLLRHQHALERALGAARFARDNSKS